MLDKPGACETRNISIATNAKIDLSKGWRPLNHVNTIQDLWDYLDNHEEGRKDGACFMQGNVNDGQRIAAKVVTTDIVVLDLDNGTDPEEVIERCKELGLEACVYSTHSHMSEETRLKVDTVLRDLKITEERHASKEEVIDYLRDFKFYVEDILEDAEFEVSEHFEYVIKHKPMPKFRVVIPWSETVVFSKLAITNREAQNIWKAKYRGVAKLLGVKNDTSCEDPSRAFYFPRHNKGADYFVEFVDGEPLNFDEIEVVLPEKKQPAQTSSKYETPGLSKFIAKYNERFEVAQFLESYGEKPEGKDCDRCEAVCPNWEGHTDPDPEARKLFAINPAESQNGGFVLGCNTNGCSERFHKGHFLDQICVANDIGVDELIKDFCPEIIEEEETEKVTFEELLEQAESVTKDNIEELMLKALRIEVRTTQRDELDDVFKEKTGLSQTKIKERWVDVRKDYKKESKSKAVSLETSDGEGKLEQFSKQYALVWFGKRLSVVNLKWKPGENPAVYQRSDFRASKENEFINVTNSDVEIVRRNIHDAWMQMPGRTLYDKMIFEPGWSEEKCAKENALNLWTGFAVKQKKGGSWNLLREHVRVNMCNEDEEYFEWLLTWMAQLVQFPGEKQGSATVVKGAMGSGKTKLSFWLREAIGKAHSVEVTQSTQVLGKFNKLLESQILVVMEEATWGGHHQANGVLKSLITSEDIVIEPKGLDPIYVTNYSRIMVCTNSDWAVPVDLAEDRRFFVLEVQNNHKQTRDTVYFSAIDDQMRNGGVEVMMFDLMNFVPKNGWDVLRNPPKTSAGAAQGLSGLSNLERCMFEIVQDGYFISSINQYGEARTVELNLTDPTKIFSKDLSYHAEQYLNKSNETHDKNDRRKLALAAKKMLKAERAGREYYSADKMQSIAYIVPPLIHLESYYQDELKIELDGSLSEEEIIASFDDFAPTDMQRAYAEIKKEADKLAEENKRKDMRMQELKDRVASLIQKRDDLIAKLKKAEQPKTEPTTEAQGKSIH